MNDDKRAILEIESAKGQRAEHAYETFFKPFFDKKNKELFDIFKDLPTSEPDKLMAVKMQTNALESLGDEIQTLINTGKLAAKSISEEDDGN